MPSQEAVREELVTLSNELASNGVTENALSELTLEQVDQKIAETKQLIANRSDELSQELAKQESTPCFLALLIIF